MTAPVRSRRRLAPVRLVVAGLVVVQGLVLIASTAAADPGTTTTALIQSASTVIYGSESADTFGVTVTGQNPGQAPTGTITVSDTTSGTTICTGTLVNTSGDVSSAICNATDTELAVGTDFTTVVATYGGDANNAGSVSTPTQTLTVTASTQSAQAQDQAVVDNLDTTYSSELNTANALGQSQGLESLTDFETQVQGLSPTALAGFYSLTQQAPQWDQIPSQMETIAADIPSTSNTANLSAFRTRLPAAGHGRRAVTQAVLTDVTGATPSPFTPQSCPTAPPEAAIFAAQIVIDVTSSVYNASQIVGEAEILGVDFAEGSAITALILAVVLGVAQIIHDTLVYLQDLANDCKFANLTGQVKNIDNTTVQTYGLITSINGLIVTLQATQATTQQDVVNILNTGLSSFQTSIEEALTVDTQTLQAATGSGTQGSSTELQTIQTALQNDMTTIDSVETTEGQKVVAGDTTINNDLSTELAGVLKETDSDAQGLTALITQQSQQILNTLQSQASTTQQQYNSLLRLQIEQALAGWGPVVPEVKFMLPVSLGGFLEFDAGRRAGGRHHRPRRRPGGRGEDQVHSRHRAQRRQHGAGRRTVHDGLRRLRGGVPGSCLTERVAPRARRSRGGQRPPSSPAPPWPPSWPWSSCPRGGRPKSHR